MTGPEDAATGPRITVLVTGVGGPAGVAVVRSLLARPDLDVVAADADRYASGLYLVPPDRRVLGCRWPADPVFAEAPWTRPAAGSGCGVLPPDRRRRAADLWRPAP